MLPQSVKWAKNVVNLTLTLKPPARRDLCAPLGSVAGQCKPTVCPGEEQGAIWSTVLVFTTYTGQSLVLPRNPSSRLRKHPCLPTWTAEAWKVPSHPLSHRAGQLQNTCQNPGLSIFLWECLSHEVSYHQSLGKKLRYPPHGDCSWIKLRSDQAALLKTDISL